MLQLEAQLEITEPTNVIDPGGAQIEQGGHSNYFWSVLCFWECIRDIVNCRSTRDMGPPECNSVRGCTIIMLYAFHTQRLIKSKFPNNSSPHT